MFNELLMISSMVYRLELLKVTLSLVGACRLGGFHVRIQASVNFLRDSGTEI